MTAPSVDAGAPGPILVTGAPGNMGTPLVGDLLALGARVRVAARDVEAARAAFGDGVEIVHFDFVDPSTRSTRSMASRGCSCSDPRRSPT